MTFNTLIEAERLANLALSMLVEFTKAAGGHLVLFDEDGGIRHHFGLAQGESPKAAPLGPAVAESLRSLRIASGGREGSSGRCWDVPLRTDDAGIGALRLYRSGGAPPFSPDDRALVEACAAHLAQSLRSRQLYEDHLVHRRRADLVERVTRAVHGPADLEETLGVVVRAAAEALGAGSGSIILGDTGGRLGAVVSLGASGRATAAPAPSAGEDRIVRWVFTEGTPFSDGMRLLAPITQVVRDRRVFDERRRSLHGWPLTRTLGVIAMAEPDARSPFTEEGLSALRVFADHAAAAIASNTLVRQAAQDNLTGAASRSQLGIRLEEEIGFARKHGIHVAAIMIDIDRFKQVNDAHGHQAGDEVLCRVADILLDAVRQNDTCARYGGDEFTLVLPETDLTGAQVVAENLRQRVAASTFARERIPVTISLGVAEFPLHANTAEGLLRRADKALYEAKESGRNCYRTASAG
jgi:diguanylate cyclase (GGDEF)-like protein